MSDTAVDPATEVITASTSLEPAAETTETWVDSGIGPKWRNGVPTLSADTVRADGYPPTAQSSPQKFRVPPDALALL